MTQRQLQRTMLQLLMGVIIGCSIHSVYLGGTQVESSPYFGLLYVIKSYTNMRKDELPTVGRCMLYKSLDADIPNTVDAAYFANPTGNEEGIFTQCKNLIHTIGPLNLDMAEADMFLIDNVDMRIRLELASPALVLMTDGNEEYKYSIEMCKLWCKKIVPVSSALIALNNVLARNTFLEYMFTRPITKTIIFPTGQSALSIESPFQGVIPHRILMFVIDQASLNGAYDRNPNYLEHLNLASISAAINGNTVANIKCDFPWETSQAFTHTLASLGHNDHTITASNFAAGRTIFAIHTRATDCTDTINLERTANLRINLQCSAACTSNKVIFLVGYTTGTIQINIDRRVFPHYLQ